VTVAKQLSIGITLRVPVVKYFLKNSGMVLRTLNVRVNLGNASLSYRGVTWALTVIIWIINVRYIVMVRLTAIVDGWIYNTDVSAKVTMRIFYNIV
jgi:hypothetical protein